MTAPVPRFLFVGGPGRSGTSHVARQLGYHEQITSFPDVELKILSEKGGLLDLQHSLVEQYSPNRASVAVQQFRRMAQAVATGQYGQPALSTLVDVAVWTATVEHFLASLSPSGHPVPLARTQFANHAQRFLFAIAKLAKAQPSTPSAKTVFLEKTPHSLLAADFIESLVPSSQYLHVMRDPRAIAYSLRRMRWGPDDLRACCAWVASYCDAFRNCVTRPPKKFPHIRQVFIEELVTNPDSTASDLTTWLGIAPMANMFASGSSVVLSAWEASCSGDDHRFLRSQLSDIAVEFGYEADEIGKRMSLSEAPSCETSVGQ
ncbi:MAG: sulfotransferase [Paracoccaceae bacterium]